MNSYYSNLIEGHHMRPRDIEQALAGRIEGTEEQRNLQLEAVAHIRVQAELDRMAAAEMLPEAASQDFIRWLHREFYKDAPAAVLRVRGAGREFRMEPGQWRSSPEADVAVGRHLPPSSDRVAAFMAYFESRYRFAVGKSWAHSSDRDGTSPIQLHPSLSGRQRSRKSVDEPRDGA
jgi:Fic family protein